MPLVSAPVTDQFDSIWDGRVSLRELHQQLHPDETEDEFDRLARGEH